MSILNISSNLFQVAKTLFNQLEFIIVIRLFIFVLMKRAVDISKMFPKHLFWDVDMNMLELEEDKDLIIPRALYATTESSFDSDIAKLEQLYTRAQIVNELKGTKEMISNLVCRLVGKRYHIKEFLRFSA